MVPKKTGVQPSSKAEGRKEAEEPAVSPVQDGPYCELGIDTAGNPLIVCPDDDARELIVQALLANPLVVVRVVPRIAEEI